MDNHNKNNYAKFNFYEIQAVFTNAEIININSDFQAIGVSTNSKTVESKNIFVALKGEKFDGHNFINEAISKNAAAIVVEKSWYNSKGVLHTPIDTIGHMQYAPTNFPLIIVENTLVALGELAFFHRMKFDFPVIAIAGSNGKTSTKELIYSVLSQKYKTLKTYKNFNNKIGVPLMMLQFSEEYEMAIIEIATNEPGEIATLSKMLSPNFGLITNIGKEHLELLKDLDEIEIEETFLFGHLLKTGGNCFINFDDERLKKYAKIIPNNISYGVSVCHCGLVPQSPRYFQGIPHQVRNDENKGNEADFKAEIDFDENLFPILKYKNPFSEEEKTYSAKINSVGLAIALNAVAAATVGFGMGLNGEEVTKGLENFSSTVDGYARMAIEEINGIKILNDCYNANPSSMEMSLKTLSLLKNFDTKIAILGDMFELGDSAEEEHKNIINLALEVANEVIVIGKNMTVAANAILVQKPVDIRIFADVLYIAEYISHFKNSNTVVLVKGSRGMKMEKLIEIM